MKIMIRVKWKMKNRLKLREICNVVFNSFWELFKLCSITLLLNERSCVQLFYYYIDVLEPNWKYINFGKSNK